MLSALSTSIHPSNLSPNRSVLYIAHFVVSFVILVVCHFKGMIDKRFAIKDRKYHIFDVGGQKSERKKWYRYVDDVKAVVFVVSLACYNEVMYEDQTKNCMVDALDLFSETVNNKQFRNAPFILFLSVYMDHIHPYTLSI